MDPVILIVDDEPAGREAIESVLITQRYRLFFAENGHDALEQAHTLLPDVILLDVMMPGIDGFETCRRLRADPLLAEVPVVMVTALDDHASRVSGLEAGADDFISKPFDRIELRARLRTITRLNRYRSLMDERANLQHQLEENARRTEELELLALASAEMRKVQNRVDMMLLLVNLAMQDVQAQAGALALINGDSLVFHAAKGLTESWLHKRMTHNANVFWNVVRDGTPRFLSFRLPETGVLDDRSSASQESIESCIIAPLKSEGKTIGLLFVGYTTRQQFRANQKRLITAIADMAGNALNRMTATEALENLVQNRTRELQTIYQVTSAASQSLDISQTFQQALALTVQAVDAQIGYITLLDETGEWIELVAEFNTPAYIRNLIERQPIANSLEGWVIEHKEALILSDMAAHVRSTRLSLPGTFLSYTGVPMLLQDRAVGVLSILCPSNQALSKESVTQISFIAGHLGLLVENQRLYQQAEKNAIVEERSRLARDLHDSVTQLLYSAALFSTGAKQFLAQGKPEAIPQYLDQIEQITQQALREMRLMVFELRSTSARKMGPIEAVQNRLAAVERRSGITAELRGANLPDMPPDVEQTLLRVVMEALNNALKHSFASNITVSFESLAGWVTAVVQDNGNGFDLEAGRLSGGVGLASMRERVEEVGGTINIESEKGKGTVVTVRCWAGLEKVSK